jgi:hypothetical protein
VFARLRAPLSGRPIGFPLAAYRPSKVAQASAVLRFVDDVTQTQSAAGTIQRLYAMQMADTTVSFAKMVDLMRVMSLLLVRPVGLLPRPERFLDPAEQNARSILGLAGSALGHALVEEEARLGYYHLVLPESPAQIVAGVAALGGHPRVWGARFLAAAAQRDHVTIGDDLLYPYMVPRPRSLVPMRFMTLGVMEFAALWAALWLGRTTTPPQGIAEIISTLNLRCPGHHKRLFHEDVPAQALEP